MSGTQLCCKWPSMIMVMVMVFETSFRTTHLIKLRFSDFFHSLILFWTIYELLWTFYDVLDLFQSIHEDIFGKWNNKCYHQRNNSKGRHWYFNTAWCMNIHSFNLQMPNLGCSIWNTTDEHNLIQYLSYQIISIITMCTPVHF